MSTDKDGTQAEEWYIAGHNGLVVDGKNGETSIDEYAKKNLRTVAIDVDVEGKYVEFAVAKASAKELCDRLNALTRKAAQADALAAALKAGCWYCSRGYQMGKTHVIKTAEQWAERAGTTWERMNTDGKSFTEFYPEGVEDDCDLNDSQRAALASYASNPAEAGA